MYLLKQVPSEAQIKKCLRKAVFGKNIFCPECRSQQVVCYENRYRCKRCRFKFSLLSHTWLKGTKLSYQNLWLILWCWQKQVPVKQTMNLMRLSEKAIRHWFDLLRSNLPELSVILEKKVQMDEAYSKGRSVLLAKQIGTRNLAWEVLTKNSVNQNDAVNFMMQYIKPRSKFQTDGAAIYKNGKKYWMLRHKVDIHKKFEFGLTSEIEGMFGNMRTSIRRMYHHTTPEKLPEYVSEFCIRFSLPEIFISPNEYLTKTLSLVPTR